MALKFCVWSIGVRARVQAISKVRIRVYAYRSFYIAVHVKSVGRRCSLGCGVRLPGALVLAARIPCFAHPLLHFRLHLQ